MTFSPSLLTRLFIASSGVFGVYAVLFGAYSSHALAGEAANWATIAIRYQIWHSIPLFALGIWSNLSTSNGPLVKVAYMAGILWILGIFLFSGSLTIMALTNWRELGVLTPIGGLTLAAGWCCIIFTAFGLKENSRLPD